jgi:type I restriction enzyme M protein
VKVEDVLKYDAEGNLISANLDIKSPRAKEDFEHMPPEKIAESIEFKEQRIAKIVQDIKSLLSQQEHD